MADQPDRINLSQFIGKFWAKEEDTVIQWGCANSSELSPVSEMDSEKCFWEEEEESKSATLQVQNHSKGVQKNNEREYIQRNGDFRDIFKEPRHIFNT